MDVAWYGSEGQIEYDLVVHPGADTSHIALRFEGTRKLALEPGGDLRVETADGPLTLRLPVVYQEAGAARTRVEGHYVLRADNEVGFALADYDKSRPLVIDPTLVYATYFGINTLELPRSRWTLSATCTSPGTPPLGRSRLEPVYSRRTGEDRMRTFLSSIPRARPCCTRPGLAGRTWIISTGLPWMPMARWWASARRDRPISPWSAQHKRPSTTEGHIAFKLNVAGDSLVYSTYLGGASTSGRAVALDASGNAYLTGAGPDFPTTSGALNNCCTFVAKLSNTGSEVYAASFGADTGRAIAVDAQGAAYIAGYSTQASFPNNPSGVCTTNTGSRGAYAAKLSADGSKLVWATFLGGSGYDAAYAIAVANDGVAYFGGETTSTDLPVTTGTLRTAYGATRTASSPVSPRTALSSDFSLTWAAAARTPSHLWLVDSNGQLVVAGTTSSRDFPIISAVQPSFPGWPYSFLKSTDSGASLVGRRAACRIYTLPTQSAILPDPSAPGTLLMDTGGGIYRSTDDGASWTNVEPNSTGMTARGLSDPSVVYAVFYCDFYKSSDGGKTWSTSILNTMECAEAGHQSQAIAVSPTDPNTVLLFSYNQEYRSTDGGQTFPQYLATPMPPNVWDSWKIVSSPDGSIYANPNSWISGLFKSTDAGLTWTTLGSGGSVLLADVKDFALSMSNPSVLYAIDGFNNIDKSTDAGATWNTVATGVPIWALAVAVSNSQVIYGLSSFGVFLSTDGGVSWNSTGALLDGPSLFGIATSPSNSAEFYISSGVLQSGFVAKLNSDGKTLDWSSYYGSHGGSTISSAAPAPSGDVWVVGSLGVYTESLPLTPDAQDANPAAVRPAFIAHIEDSTASCSYAVNPGTQYSYVAGELVFSVTAPSGCAWTATPSDTWIHLIQNLGTGSATIPLLVDANTTAATRTGTVAVADQAFTITEPPSSCHYSLDNTSFQLPSSGGQVTVNVTAGAGCAWSVVPIGLTVVSGGSGTGNGSVTLSAPGNIGLSAIAFSALVATQNVNVYVAEDCTYLLSPLTFDGTSRSFSVGITASGSACQWQASIDASWLAFSSSTTGVGSGSLSFSTSENKTGGPRTAHLHIGSQTLTLTQTVDTLPQCTLTVDIDPPGAGTAGPSGVYDSGTYLCLDVTANAGWSFTGWSGALQGDYSCLTISADTTVTANFVYTSALQFVPMTPCRVVDTRNAAGTFGGPTIGANGTRSFPLPTSTACTIPSNAAAYSLNIGIVPQGFPGYVTVWPTGQALPGVSTLNRPDGSVRSTAAIIPAGTGGAISVFADNAPTDVVVDINGYFVPAGTSGALAFYPVTPCRMVDTRTANGDLGGPYLAAGVTRIFPLLEASSCGVSAQVQAYSLNLTAVPRGSVMHWLTAWAGGQAQPGVATLNDPTATVLANAAIVPAGAGGNIAVYSLQDTDLVIDVNGYFAPPGAGGLSLYNLTPCRVLDTRQPTGSQPFNGTLNVDVAGSGCGVPASAQAHVFNATVVPPGLMHYLTLWPQGIGQPGVSSLNDPAGIVRANMAIVPTTNGSISAFVTNPTYLILDVFGYFAP